MDHVQDDIEYYSQERDFWGNLKRDLQELRGISTLVYELIQNADDVKTLDGEPGGAHEISFDVRDDCLIVENDGVFSDCGQLKEDECPWKATRRHRCDFHRMKQVGGGDKRNENDNTGAFGIGFNAVYQITDHPIIISNGHNWQLVPENNRGRRIIGARNTDVQGTRFVLPWALDPNSAVRQELKGTPAVNISQIDGFLQEIQSALPKAAIFLKQITSLNLLRNGHNLFTVKREENEHTIDLWINGEKTTWQVFHHDFADDASILRAKHPGAIEPTRRSIVKIAVPDSSLVQGYLFADLPTETLTNLPFHIQADFYPTSDRKRILLDDSISSEWNQLAIRSAAIPIAKSFDRIQKLFKPIQFWDWIAQIHKGGKETLFHPAFAVFWDNLNETLVTKRALITSKDERTYLQEACLLASDEEIAATDIWESVNIKIVHPDLRKHFTLLQELGTPRLRLSDITHGLLTGGITGTISYKQVPMPLRINDGWIKFWKAVNVLWNTRTRSSAEERDIASRDFANLAIAPGTDGNLHIPAKMFNGDPTVQKIFPELVWLKILPDQDPIMKGLIQHFTVSEAVTYLISLPAGSIEERWRSGKFPIDSFYQWLESRRDEVIDNPELLTYLRGLSIWPAGGHLHPLDNLYLPGGFDDPFGLASVINISDLGGRFEFLRDVLKVKFLDFPTYIREQLSIAFKNTQLSGKLVSKLVNQLARRLGDIRDFHDVRRILQNLPLVLCQDNEFYPAIKVYFNNPVNRVLGYGLKLAILPTESPLAVEDLYDWLGVARQPRDEDILDRITKLTSQNPNAQSIQAIETLFIHLGQRWKLIYQNDTVERRLFDQKFSLLKRMRWLPGSRNPDQWFSPDTLYVSFNKYLFETQGNFLTFSAPIQREASDFLEFLVINRNPLPIHIVRHILYCSDHGIPVNWQVYTALSYKESLADEAAIQELQGKPCLLISENPVRYVRPDQVFWSDHPFGIHRFKLGPGLRPYEELLNKLGVRISPEIRDYVQVLLDISNQFRNNPLDEETSSVVMSCWRKLSDALSAGLTMSEDIKSKLCGQKVIPDPRQVLTVPEHLFFEDRAGLAIRFDALLKNNVIQRTEGCWLAMESVGVQLLSRLIEVDLSEGVDSEPDTALYNRVQERKLLIQRIIDAEQTAGSELASRNKLLSLDFQRAADLEIVMTIHVFNRRYQTEPEKTNAVLKDNTFYSVWVDNLPSWAAIGRELALALKPSGEIGSLAMGIKEVLSAPSYASASASLDELNYPPLQASEPAPEPQGAVIDGPIEDPLTAILGGTPPPIPPAPYAPPEDPRTGGTRSRGEGKPKPRRRTSRIITYVYPDDDLLPPREKPDRTSRKRTVTEQAGVELVIKDEEKYHRDAIDKNKDTPNHPGYDLEATERETGAIRYIEVKSLSGTWDSTNPILMTKTEFEMAQAKGAEYWLYIVEQATSENHQIYRIQDPANRANYYLFDHGWEPLAVE